MKLKSRTHKKEEGLAELAEEVEASPDMLELLAKDQFIDALLDGDT